MSMPHASNRLELPVSLQTQLHEYRRRVWTIKSIEAACGATFGVLVSYLTLFALDRVIDTPGWVRLARFRRGRRRRAPWCRSICIAGSGGIAGWNNWPGC